jgi:hypothetical protein
MSFFFWGLIAAMLVAAIAIVAWPLDSGKRIMRSPRVLLIALVPLTAVGLYVALGSPATIGDNGTAPHRGMSTPGAAGTGNESAGIATVASLIDGLETRLQQEPDDGLGWLLLARSYEHVDQRVDAVAAYERAKSLGESNAELEQKLYSAVAVTTAAETQSTAAIRGRLSLSPEVAVQVQSSDTIFIFAKESAEQRMPVAALRKSVADLPLDFVLSDAEAMVPGTSISDYAQLVVTARVSRTGNAGDTLNGLETTTAPISTASGDTINLLISTGVTAEGPGNE